MQYQLKGQYLPHLSVQLDPGEVLRCQPGAMIYMAGLLNMQTKIHGGVLGGARRKMAGESAFMVNFEAEESSVLGLAPAVPGSIMALELNGQEVLCERGCLLAAQETVDISVATHKKLKAGLLGGEKMIFQKLRGTGTVFLAAAGDMISFTLAPGQVMRADNKALLWYDSSVEYDVERIKGVKNMWQAGEGMFLTRLKGPGRIGLQSYAPASHVNHGKSNDADGKSSKGIFGKFT